MNRSLEHARPRRRPSERRHRPSFDGLECRFVPSGNVAGIAGDGSVFSFQPPAGWSFLGGSGFSNLVNVTTGTTTQLFAQTPTGAVYVHTTGTTWTPTGGAFIPGTMVASTGGVAGIAGDGSVFHYQTSGGWSFLGGSGFSKLVDVPLGLGFESLYAQTATGAVSFFASGTTWTSTHGALIPGTMIANAGGVSGIAGDGSIFHYQTTGGWSSLGGSAFVDLVDVPSSSTGSDELFAQTASGAVSQHTGGTWSSTGGGLLVGSMVASDGGVTGRAWNGTVFHYQTSGGWSYLAGSAFVDVVASPTGTAGADQLYAQTSSGLLYYYAGNGVWTSSGGGLLVGSLVP